MMGQFVIIICLMDTHLFEKKRVRFETQNQFESNSSFRLRDYRKVSRLSTHNEQLSSIFEDSSLFPEEVSELICHETRNISSFKKHIELEKQRVDKEFTHLKREMALNIEGFKLSIFEELDQIYRSYLEKYSILKQETNLIRHLREEIKMDINRTIIYPTQHHSKTINSQNSSTTSNRNILRSLEKSNKAARSSQMLSYVTQMQREKIENLERKAKELISLTKTQQSQYFKAREFQKMANHQILEEMNKQLKKMYDNKYEYFILPEMIIENEEPQILKEVYELQSPLDSASYASHKKSKNIVDSNSVVKLFDYKENKIQQKHRNISVESTDVIRVQYLHSIKQVAQAPIICIVEVNKDQLALGSTDGYITIYNLTSKSRVKFKAHSTSVITLAIVVNKGKQYLASGGDLGCNSVILWDTVSWSMHMKLENHKGAVTAIADLRDNCSIVSGSYDKMINIYDLNNSGKVIFDLSVNNMAIAAIALNSTGSKMISSGLNNSLAVWQIIRNSNDAVQAMILQRIIQNNAAISCISTSSIVPHLLFLGTGDGSIKLLNINTGEAYKTIICGSFELLEIVVLERRVNPEYPIVIFRARSEAGLKIINTETGQGSNVEVKDATDVNEIGSKCCFIANGSELAMASQAEMIIFGMEIK